MMRKTTILILCALVICACKTKQTTQEEEIVWPLGFRTDTLTVRESKVQSGEVFFKLFTRLGMPGTEIGKLTRACDGQFDVTRLRAGNRVDAYYAGDTLAPKLRYVVYQKDRINSTVFQCYDSLAVWNVAKQVDTVRKYTDVTIKNSLWNDMIAAGASPLLILELADVYAWTVDFFGLHEGDRFRAFYHQRVCEDEVIDILGVDFAEYTRGRDTLYAIRFDQGDNGNKYWNQKGESMRKAFLKAPLKFTRISSRFS